MGADEGGCGDAPTMRPWPEKLSGSLEDLEQRLPMVVILGCDREDLDKRNNKG